MCVGGGGGWDVQESIWGCLSDTEVMTYFISSCSGTVKNLTWELNRDTVDPELLCSFSFPLIRLPIPFQLLQITLPPFLPAYPFHTLIPLLFFLLFSPALVLYSYASLCRGLLVASPTTSPCYQWNNPAVLASFYQPAFSRDKWLIRCHCRKWKVNGQ